MEILRADPGHPIRKRLWQAAIATGLILAILLGSEAFSRITSRSHRLSLGEDFLPAYAAGILVHQGHPSDLYSSEPLARMERDIVATADLDPLPAYGIFLNPPFFAATYAPFAVLPYRQALAVWLGLNLALLATSIILLVHMLPANANWKSWGLVPFLAVLPLPFWEAMYHQQNTFVSLALLCIVTSLWRARSLLRVPASPRPRVSSAFIAGAVAGLLFYKPQLALMVAVVLVLTRGWRPLLGLSITGLLLLIFTLHEMPGSLTAFLHALPPTIERMRTQLPYNWGRQVTPQSFWRLLIQGGAIGPTNLLPRVLSLATAAGFGLGLAAAILRFIRRHDAGPSLDRLIAATIVSMPMVMPYYMDYDLLLLAIPAVLFAADWMKSNVPLTRSDRILLGVWITLFFEFYINPGVASRTGLNLAQPLLGIIAGLSIARCFRANVATQTEQRYDSAAVAVAA